VDTELLLLGSRLTGRQAGNKPQQLDGQSLKVGRSDRTAWMNHDVPSWGNLLSMQSDYFAEPAPDAVTSNSAAQCLFDAPAEPADAEAIRSKEDRKLATRFAAAAAIYSVIFNATHQSADTGKLESRRIRRA
jgi:hypothetical protein